MWKDSMQKIKYLIQCFLKGQGAFYMYVGISRNFGGGKEKRGKLIQDKTGRGHRWVDGKLGELFCYLSSHFWLGYAPWGVRWAGWGWQPGADWRERAWRCADGCVGAGACADVGETQPSGVKRGLAAKRAAPGPALNSEPGSGCSTPASGGHAL